MHEEIEAIREEHQERNDERLADLEAELAEIEDTDTSRIWTSGGRLRKRIWKPSTRNTTKNSSW